MKKYILTFLSVLSGLAGIAGCLCVLFVRYLRGMDQSWFVSHFGPNGDEAHRTYDLLYQQSLVITHAANRDAVAFYASVGLGALTLSIALALWLRDVRELERTGPKRAAE